MPSSRALSFMTARLLRLGNQPEHASAFDATPPCQSQKGPKKRCPGQKSITVAALSAAGLTAATVGVEVLPFGFWMVLVDSTKRSPGTIRFFPYRPLKKRRRMGNIMCVSSWSGQAFVSTRAPATAVQAGAPALGGAWSSGVLELISRNF